MGRLRGASGAVGLLGIGLFGADDAFPRRAREFEIKEERELEICDYEVAGHLGDVRVAEGARDFRVYNHEVVNDEVGDKGADALAFVVNRERFLLFDAVAASGEFDNERVFVEFFVEAGFQGVEHFHGSADDGFAEFFVDQGMHRIWVVGDVFWSGRNGRVARDLETEF